MIRIFSRRFFGGFRLAAVAVVLILGGCYHSDETVTVFRDRPAPVDPVDPGPGGGGPVERPVIDPDGGEPIVLPPRAAPSPSSDANPAPDALDTQMRVVLGQSTEPDEVTGETAVTRSLIEIATGAVASGFLPPQRQIADESENAQFGSAARYYQIEEDEEGFIYAPAADGNDFAVMVERVEEMNDESVMEVRTRPSYFRAMRGEDDSNAMAGDALVESHAAAVIGGGAAGVAPQEAAQLTPSLAAERQLANADAVLRTRTEVIDGELVTLRGAYDGLQFGSYIEDETPASSALSALAAQSGGSAAQSGGEGEGFFNPLTRTVVDSSGAQIFQLMNGNDPVTDGTRTLPITILVADENGDPLLDSRGNFVTRETVVPVPVFVMQSVVISIMREARVDGDGNEILDGITGNPIMDIDATVRTVMTVRVEVTGFNIRRFTTAERTRFNELLALPTPTTDETEELEALFAIRGLTAAEQTEFNTLLDIDPAARTRAETNRLSELSVSRNYVPSVALDDLGRAIPMSVIADDTAAFAHDSIRAIEESYQVPTSEARAIQTLRGDAAVLRWTIPNPEKYLSGGGMVDPASVIPETTLIRSDADMTGLVGDRREASTFVTNLQRVTLGVYNDLPREQESLDNFFSRLLSIGESRGIVAALINPDGDDATDDSVLSQRASETTENYQRRFEALLLANGFLRGGAFNAAIRRADGTANDLASFLAQGPDESDAAWQARIVPRGWATFDPADSAHAGLAQMTGEANADWQARLVALGWTGFDPANSAHTDMLERMSGEDIWQTRIRALGWDTFDPTEAEDTAILVQDPGDSDFDYLARVVNNALDLDLLALDYTQFEFRTAFEEYAAANSITRTTDESDADFLGRLIADGYVPGELSRSESDDEFLSRVNGDFPYSRLANESDADFVARIRDGLERLEELIGLASLTPAQQTEFDGLDAAIPGFAATLRNHRARIAELEVMEATMRAAMQPELDMLLAIPHDSRTTEQARRLIELQIFSLPELDFLRSQNLEQLVDTNFQRYAFVVDRQAEFAERFDNSLTEEERPEFAAFGLETPSSAIPSDGRADYSGAIQGVFHQAGGRHYAVVGRQVMTADFTDAEISGSGRIFAHRFPNLRDDGLISDSDIRNALSRISLGEPVGEMELEFRNGTIDGGEFSGEVFGLAGTNRFVRPSVIFGEDDLRRLAMELRTGGNTQFADIVDGLLADGFDSVDRLEQGIAGVLYPLTDGGGRFGGRFFGPNADEIAGTGYLEDDGDNRLDFGFIGSCLETGDGDLRSCLYQSPAAVVPDANNAYPSLAYVEFDEPDIFDGAANPLGGLQTDMSLSAETMDGNQILSVGQGADAVLVTLMPLDGNGIPSTLRNLPLLPGENAAGGRAGENLIIPVANLPPKADGSDYAVGDPLAAGAIVTVPGRYAFDRTAIPGALADDMDRRVDSDGYYINDENQWLDGADGNPLDVTAVDILANRVLSPDLTLAPVTIAVDTMVVADTTQGGALVAQVLAPRIDSAGEAITNFPLVVKTFSDSGDPDALLFDTGHLAAVYRQQYSAMAIWVSNWSGYSLGLPPDPTDPFAAGPLESGRRDFAIGFGGVETAAGAVPTAGIAEYAGAVAGNLNRQSDGSNFYAAGTIELEADFGLNEISSQMDIYAYDLALSESGVPSDLAAVVDPSESEGRYRGELPLMQIGGQVRDGDVPRAETDGTVITPATFRTIPRNVFTSAGVGNTGLAIPDIADGVFTPFANFEEVTTGTNTGPQVDHLRTMSGGFFGPEGADAVELGGIGVFQATPRLDAQGNAINGEQLRLEFGFIGRKVK